MTFSVTRAKPVIATMSPHHKIFVFLDMYDRIFSD
jgi:hypothetical protein